MSLERPSIKQTLEASSKVPEETEGSNQWESLAFEVSTLFNYWENLKLDATLQSLNLTYFGGVNRKEDLNPGDHFVSNPYLVILGPYFQYDDIHGHAEISGVDGAYVQKVLKKEGPAALASHFSSRLITKRMTPDGWKYQESKPEDVSSLRLRRDIKSFNPHERETAVFRAEMDDSHLNLIDLRSDTPNNFSTLTLAKTDSHRVRRVMAKYLTGL